MRASLTPNHTMRTPAPPIWGWCQSPPGQESGRAAAAPASCDNGTSGLAKPIPRKGTDGHEGRLALPCATARMAESRPECCPPRRQHGKPCAALWSGGRPQSSPSRWNDGPDNYESAIPSPLGPPIGIPPPSAVQAPAHGAA